MSLFGLGGKKSQKAKKSKKSKPREVWQGKSFALDDIITPSVLVGGGENSPDPFLIDLHTVPGSEIDFSQSDLLQALDPNSLELLNQPHISLLDHQVMSDWLVDPSSQPLPFFDNPGVSTNSFTENVSILDSPDACPLDSPSPGSGNHPGVSAGTSGWPNFELPDVNSTVPILPFDPLGTDRPPKFNFKKSDQPLIGVIDTGFNANNPDIDYSRVKLGRDLVDNDNNPLLADGEGSEHGTHVLGIISATEGNDIGIDGINDQAPVWVGRAIGSGKWAESLREFVDEFKASGQPNGVVNLSFDLTQTNPDGSVTTRYELTPQEREALEYARQNAVIVVVAAGNDGGTMSALGQASQEFDNIITVGSIDWNNKRAEYSSYGDGLDLVAPGGTADEPIISTVGEGADLNLLTEDDETSEDEVDAITNDFSEEVFGCYCDTKESETDVLDLLEDLTSEEKQAYEEAIAEIQKLLSDYLDPDNVWFDLNELEPEFTEGLLDAIGQFFKAFEDEEVSETLLAALAESLETSSAQTADDLDLSTLTNSDFSIPFDFGIGEMAGTSVAAAKVTGAVSQVWAANPHLSYLQVKEILKQTAVDLSTPGWDEETGAGLVNIATAVELAKHTQPEAYQPKPLLSPLTWDGEGQVTPGERAVSVFVPTFTGRIINSGYVRQTGWLRIRSGPGQNYSAIGYKYPGDAINFDAYENNGSWVSDPNMPGGGSSRWYKIAGTNNWVSALYVDNTPEQAQEARRRAEEEARRRAEEEARRRAEEERRKQEQLQGIINQLSKKIGVLGNPVRSNISNGVAVYHFAKGILYVQPDGRYAFYDTFKKAKTAQSIYGGAKRIYQGSQLIRQLTSSKGTTKIVYDWSRKINNFNKFALGSKQKVSRLMTRTVVAARKYFLRSQNGRLEAKIAKFITTKARPVIKTFQTFSKRINKTLPFLPKLIKSSKPVAKFLTKRVVPGLSLGFTAVDLVTAKTPEEKRRAYFKAGASLAVGVVVGIFGTPLAGVMAASLTSTVIDTVYLGADLLGQGNKVDNVLKTSFDNVGSFFSGVGDKMKSFFR
ncbi:MAG: S8 family serine peptidase [Nostoc sp.]|uniref:S8 family serine peptidase n=1 Tax=Nostoc sp. TaxID=1180 RepID=UPI002FF7D9B1